MYTIKDLFDLVLPNFQGSPITVFRSPNAIAKAASLIMRARIDLVESKHVSPLIPALLSGDNIYVYPQDASALIDISPMQGRNFSGVPFFKNSISRDISMAKSAKNMCSVEYRNGTKLLRILTNQSSETPYVINMCDSLTADGLILTGSGAKNARIDTIQFLNGAGSIAFDITANAVQSIVAFQNTTIKNLSAYPKGIIALGLFVPANINGVISSVQLKLGNDMNFVNSKTFTVTTNAFGGDFLYGFNMLRFDIANGSVTGNFDTTTINNMQVIINTSNNLEELVGLKVDAIAAYNGVGYELSYYSKNIFQIAGTSKLTDTPTDASLLDIVLIDDDAANILLHEMIKVGAKELRGKEGGDAISYANKELDGVYGDATKIGLYQIYKERNTSERLGVGGSY